MTKDPSIYDVAYAGAYPDTFDPKADGRWYTVLSSGSPVGTAWTNDKNGFGFVPASVTPETDAAIHDAINTYRILAELGKQGSHSASDTFDAGKQLSGYSSVDERRGRLATVLPAPTEEPAVTAAAPEDSGIPTNPIFPDGGNVPATGATLAVSLDDQDNILELMYVNRDGLYLRDNGQWTLTDTSVDNPTVDDREWVDVTPQFVSQYDQLVNESDGLTRDDIAGYLAPVV